MDEGLTSRGDTTAGLAPFASRLGFAKAMRSGSSGLGRTFEPLRFVPRCCGINPITTPLSVRHDERSDTWELTMYRAEGSGR